MSCMLLCETGMWAFTWLVWKLLWQHIWWDMALTPSFRWHINLLTVQHCRDGANYKGWGKSRVDNVNVSCMKEWLWALLRIALNLASVIKGTQRAENRTRASYNNLNNLRLFHAQSWNTEHQNHLQQLLLFAFFVLLLRLPTLNLGSLYPCQTE